MKRKTASTKDIMKTFVLAGILTVGANSAVAGEVNGKGDPVPGGEKGRSECSYSGQQDDPVADAGFFKGDRVQNWGQIPKMVRDFLRTVGLSPGDACNPKKSG